MGTRPYRSAEWRDALVVVESGELELESSDGTRWAFAAGTVLWLAGLRLRALHNPRADIALLAAISRCREEEARPREGSSMSC